MRYIIQKASRWSETPHPYDGPACIEAGVPGGQYYEDYDAAVADCRKLGQVNPVGFVVVEIE